jgi:activator of 2-hydroxyglutaryl-CoA dehydratase
MPHSVETVAHTEAGLHFYEGVDVICDVGGQDIKIIILKNGRVKDFKLNTQCSAGNGYFLQSTAQGFNVKVEEYADVAFAAKGFPSFGYGCAVFMQSDIVDFQRQGWKPEEIMAGLCNVLPKNIWLYVSQIPNLSAIGTKFLLQGGTQYNLAGRQSAGRFHRIALQGQGHPAEVIVHEHCGEAGAIGAALEAGRLWDNGASAPSSGSTPAPPSLQDRRAKKPHAATSARTSACAPSSTSRPPCCPPTISARRRPRSRSKRARSG